MLAIFLQLEITIHLYDFLVKNLAIKLQVLLVDYDINL